MMCQESTHTECVDGVGCMNVFIMQYYLLLTGGRELSFALSGLELLLLAPLVAAPALPAPALLPALPVFPFWLDCVVCACAWVDGTGKVASA